MTIPAVAHSYDDIPYPGETYVLSHPTHLATIAMLMGMQPPPVERCRVLELGCANGSNLIPMADDLPGSTFVGIDLSASQIADGHAMVTTLGLQNI
jgi:tRNA G46 methylase TrmB